eukprot:TRINITY_DN1592_c0_g1_i1.p1 TRINITY_DN1592_c0_g1~~TRINITY_DN1592_c0_g1_i1.p1  ORF type:complete len:321 (+),score=67.78 TRINITY_DN1592_c0_g1_i1:119-1081(+)
MARLSNESPGYAFYAISIACLLIAQSIAYLASNFEFLSQVAWLGLFSFLYQWIIFIPSAYLRTAAYFDVAGSSGYFVLALYSLFRPGYFYTRQIIVTLCVLVWAARLGWLLYQRVQRAGGDSRFDEIKQHNARFFNMWSIQALWVFLVSLPVYCLNSNNADPTLGPQDMVGLGLWLVGFSIEVVADLQKTVHNTDPATQGSFIQTGLWNHSRHPNYFGEIVLWCGLLITSASTFDWPQYISICSPLFVTYLLLEVSGIPLLEAKADSKWGHDEEYRAYKERTPKLVPWFVTQPESDLGVPMISKTDDLESDVTQESRSCG